MSDAADVGIVNGQVTMGAADLIQKLVAIERAVGKTRTLEVHSLVLEAQGFVLEIQRQMIETLRENARLRERMEKYEPTSPARMRESWIPSNAEIARELARPKAPAEEKPIAAIQLVAS